MISKMNSILSIAILSIFCIATASQQTPQTPQQEKELEDLAKQYGVTKEEMNKLIRDQMELRKRGKTEVPVPQDILNKIAQAQLAIHAFKCPDAATLKQYAQGLPSRGPSEDTIINYKNQTGITFLTPHYFDYSQNISYMRSLTQFDHVRVDSSGRASPLITCAYRYWSYIPLPKCLKCLEYFPYYEITVDLQTLGFKDLDQTKGKVVPSGTSRPDVWQSSDPNVVFTYAINK
jgi:hypothetical protein